MDKSASVTVLMIYEAIEGVVATLATLLFVYMKLTDLINKSWWFVLVPTICYATFSPFHGRQLAHLRLVHVNNREDN